MLKKNSLWALFFILSSLILSCGCISSQEKTEYPSSAQVQLATDANNRFALDLYSQIGSEKSNVFFSPWSIYSALSMIYEGARGRTADEMQSVMHLPENDSIRRQSFAALYDKFNSANAGYTLSNANALWVQKDYSLLRDYTSVVDEYYHGKAENVDFKGATEDARQTINSWVEDRTNDRIKDLIPPGILDPMTRLVLTNAIYFKGSWVREFDRNETQDENFRTEDGRTVKVPMMRSFGEESLYNYMETEDMQMLEIPYKGWNLSMIVLLPKSDDISPLERSLTPEKLVEWKRKLKELQVDVYIPKFTFNTKYFLIEDLEDMGMGTAFAGAADLSGISSMENLSISDVIHQAFVEVNEVGTEAAAATAVVIERAAPDGPKIPVFRADHPFIFMIQDRETGSILFMGRVSDPRAK